jgi:hypothetical protein
MEMPASEKTRRRWSVRRFRRTAATTPKATPTRTAMTVERIASSAVAGIYLPRFSRTGWWS